MKSVGSILFVLFFACILAAAPGLPVIYLESSEQEHTVESTGTWAEINSSAPAGKTAGTLAEKLKSPGKSYRWTPSPMREKLTGGADLTDAVLSPDGSVLFLAERIGGSICSCRVDV